MRHTDTGLPRRIPQPHPPAAPAAPTDQDIEHAQAVYDQHVPTLTRLDTCIAAGCGPWPCRESRNAETILRAAGRLPVTWIPVSAPTTGHPC